MGGDARGGPAQKRRPSGVGRKRCSGGGSGWLARVLPLRGYPAPQLSYGTLYLWAQRPPGTREVTAGAAREHVCREKGSFIFKGQQVRIDLFSGGNAAGPR